MGQRIAKKAKTPRTRHKKDRTIRNRSASRTLYFWTFSTPHRGFGIGTRRRALRTLRSHTGAGGGGARGARGGNWTWSGACCADGGYARGVAGRASALDAGTASLTNRGQRPPGEANEKQSKGSGTGSKAEERPSRRSSLPQAQPGLAVWGECPKACNKQESIPGKLPRYATVVGPGTQPAGWDWRPTEKCRSGPPRRCRGHLKVLRPRRRGTVGRLRNAPAAGLK